MIFEHWLQVRRKFHNGGEGMVLDAVREVSTGGAACPFLELDSEFPNQLFLGYHPPTGRYGCFYHQGIDGLAAFSTKELALAFMQRISLPDIKVLEKSFDQARELAKQRPLPVVALMLLDDITDPRIHYVR